MGKKDKKKGAGAAKTAAKTEKKANKKLKKELVAGGEEEVEAQLARRLAEASASATGQEVEVAAPEKRSSFTFLPHPDKEQLILFGGEYFNGSRTTVYNDLLLYHIKTNRWSRLSLPSAPPPRSGHQALVVSQGGGQMWVFGGEFTSPSQSQFYHYKDLWVFHLSEKRWEKVNAPGGPSPRSGHRMVCVRRHLLVFGGFRDSGRSYNYFNDLYAFSLQDLTWSLIKPTGTPPCPRSACQMAALPDGRVVVSGGYSRHPVKRDVDKGVTHSDMFVLTFEKDTWKWVAVKQGGVVPYPRSGISLSQPPLGEKVFLFGGVHDQNDDEEELEGEFYNDLYQLDLIKHVWHTVTVTGRKDLGDKKRRRKKNEEPGGGEREVEELMEDMQMKEEEVKQETVSTDGIFTVTVGASQPITAPNSEKKQEESSVFVPSPRINPGLAIRKGILYLYGGMFEVGDRQLTLSDFYSLDLGKLDEWKVIIPPEPESEMEWLESDSESESDSEDEDDSEEEEDMDVDY